MENIEQIVARNVRDRRKELGWTQSELANRAKLNLQTISRIENATFGTRKANLEAVASALGCTREQLMTMPAEKTPTVNSLLNIIRDLEKQLPSEIAGVWSKLKEDDREILLSKMKLIISKYSSKKSDVG